MKAYDLVDAINEQTSKHGNASSEVVFIYDGGMASTTLVEEITTDETTKEIIVRLET